MKPRSKSLFHIFTLFALMLSLLGSALTVTPARAAGFTVTKTADTADGACNADCSLREAITAANNVAGADTITVPAGIYTLTIAGAGENLNATGDLDIPFDLTINGAGAGNTIIQAGTDNTNGIDRVIQIFSSSVMTLSGVTIRYGKCPSCEGGGILTDGALTITTSAVSNNSTATTGEGGGIYSSNSLTITNSTIDNNTAGGSSNGGGIRNLGILILSNSAVADNNAAGGSGGGIQSLNAITTTLINSTVSGNDAATEDGLALIFGTINISNTILAGNGTNDCYLVAATIGINTNNLIVNNSGCGTPTVTTNPNLSALANNGGPTLTFALPLGSSALDAGDTTTCNNAPISGLDQRGMARPSGSCDIGSFEYTDAVAPNTTILTKPPVRTLNTSASFTFSGTDDISLPANLTFECKLDGGAFAPCTSPKSYIGLTAVKHTFSVRATDEAANVDATPVSYSWTVQKERAKNGGFNIYTSSAQIPQFWVRNPAFSPITDGKDTIIKKEGTASVKINEAGTTKMLNQTLTLSGLTGDKFTFSFWARGASIPVAGLCRAQVLLFDGTTLKMTKTINCSNGTYTTFQKKTLTFNATSNYTKVIIRFTYSKASGTVWFDLVSLIK